MPEIVMLVVARSVPMEAVLPSVMGPAQVTALVPSIDSMAPLPVAPKPFKVSGTATGEVKVPSSWRVPPESTCTNWALPKAPPVVNSRKPLLVENTPVNGELLGFVMATVPGKDSVNVDEPEIWPLIVSVRPRVVPIEELLATVIGPASVGLPAITNSADS